MIFLYLLVLRDDKFISFVLRDSTPACIHTIRRIIFPDDLFDGYASSIA